MRRLPPLNALQIFETVARHRSFTRAADHLCLTQGAVSRQIIALEDYYKFPLFKRHAKGLTRSPPKASCCCPQSRRASRVSRRFRCGSRGSAPISR